jgi:predicted metalloprotease with PDZ domain
MPRPHTHLFEVTMTIDGWSEPRLDLVMPSWTPGSYMIREYARHVQEFTVESDGHPARWEKTAKDAWRVETPLGGRIKIGYRVYAYDLTVRTASGTARRCSSSCRAIRKTP